MGRNSAQGPLSEIWWKAVFMRFFLRKNGTCCDWNVFFFISEVLKIFLNPRLSLVVPLNLYYLQMTDDTCITVLRSDVISQFDIKLLQEVTNWPLFLKHSGKGDLIYSTSPWLETFTKMFQSILKLYILRKYHETWMVVYIRELEVKVNTLSVNDSKTN